MATLRVGSRGNEVVTLQRLLLANGFDPQGVDGDFGPNTKAAVVAFQRSRGLPPDGVVGAGTWAALNAPAAPVAVPALGPAAGLAARTAAGGVARRPTVFDIQSVPAGPQVRAINWATILGVAAFLALALVVATRGKR